MTQRAATEDLLLAGAASGSGGAPRPRALVRCLRASPPWLAGLFAAHLLAFGLLPALLESSRLTAEEARLSTELERTLTRQRELARLRQAQQDPIYVERERRARRVLPPSPPVLEPQPPYPSGE